MARRDKASPPKAAPATERKKPAIDVAPTLPSSPQKKARKGGSEVVPPLDPDEFVPQDLQAIFGENLKAARLKRGLKQSEVAERTGLTQMRLSVIESGRQNLTLKTMTKLAEAVNRSLSTLLLKAKDHPP
jgi:DNA-binding XRE family transcriptional regulator